MVIEKAENCTKNHNHTGRVIRDRNHGFGRILVVVCIYCDIDYRVIMEGKEKDVDHFPWVLDAVDDYLKAQVLLNAI